MTTKMKGLFKGLRYISQIFEEEKEEELQIGFPTDVKHVAHIGSDGHSVETPSWMKEFKSPTQSAPLDSGPPREDPDFKWVSEDSKRGVKERNSPQGDTTLEAPRSSRRHHTADSNASDSPRKKDPSTRSRKSRRNHSKDLSEGNVKSNRQQQDSGQASGSTSRNLPDIPKKSHRKKPKESSSGSGSSRSRSRATACNGNHTSDSGGPVPSMHDQEEKE